MELNHAYRIKTSDAARENALSEAAQLLRDVSEIAATKRSIVSPNRLRWIPTWRLRPDGR